MKSKIILLVVIFIAIAIVFSTIGKSNEKDEFKPLELEVGEIFTYINTDKTLYVLNYIIEDVTGDAVRDMIILVGEKENVASVKAQNIDIVIYDLAKQNFSNLNLKNFEGKMPKLEARELTGDGVLDVIAILDNDKEEKNIRIVSKQENEFKEIFKAKDNRGIIFFGNFLDGFVASIKCIKLNKNEKLDLKDRKDNYITNNFYDEAGRILKSDAKINTTSFKSVEFVQLNGYYGIQTTQKILGFNNDDLLDEIITVWKFEEGKWQIKEARGNVLGNLLY